MAAGLSLLRFLEYEEATNGRFIRCGWGVGSGVGWP